MVVDVGHHTVAHIGRLIELHGQHTHSLWREGEREREGGTKRESLGLQYTINLVCYGMFLYILYPGFTVQ